MNAREPETEAIEDATDARLSDLRHLRDREWLDQHACFVAEGTGLVEQALADPRLRVTTLLVSPTAYARLRSSLVGRENLRIWIARTPVMRQISGVSFHQGCVALVTRPESNGEVAAWSARRFARIVVVEDVTDPDNIGGLFRNAFAFGVHGVLLSPRCASPLYRKALRTSLGAALRVPFVHASDVPGWDAAISRLVEAGYDLVALTPRARSSGLADLTREGGLPPRIALCVGNEGIGLSSRLLSRASTHLCISMVSAADSVNVATAAAIVLAQIFHADASGGI